MRRWKNTRYDMIGAIYTSDDGYYLTFDFDHGHWYLNSPEGYIIGLFDQTKILREQYHIQNYDPDFISYLLYRSESTITRFEHLILKPFKKILRVNYD